MDNTGRVNAQTAVTNHAAGERVVARLRPHGRALFWPTLALLAVVAATGYFYGRFPIGWQQLALVAGATLAVIVLFLLPLIRWLARSYTITTRRIILQSGSVVRVRQELLHSRGYDVTVRRSGLQGLFRSGDVQVNNGLEHPVVLRDLPFANLVQAALHDLMEANQPMSAAQRRNDGGRSPDETTAWGTR